MQLNEMPETNNYVNFVIQFHEFVWIFNNLHFWSFQAFLGSGVLQGANEKQKTYRGPLYTE